MLDALDIRASLNCRLLADRAQVDAVMVRNRYRVPMGRLPGPWTQRRLRLAIGQRSTCRVGEIAAGRVPLVKFLPAETASRRDDLSRSGIVVGRTIRMFRWTPLPSSVIGVLMTKEGDEDLSIVVLERIEPEANAYRYYVLSVEPTLFAEASLVREWGRIGRPGGRIVSLFADRSKARMELGAWLERKKKRGYALRR